MSEKGSASPMQLEKLEALNRWLVGGGVVCQLSQHYTRNVFSLSAARGVHDAGVLLATWPFMLPFETGEHTYTHYKV